MSLDFTSTSTSASTWTSTVVLMVDIHHLFKECLSIEAFNNEDKA